MKTRPPEFFLKFAGQFYISILEMEKTMEGVVRFASAGLTPEQRAELIAFFWTTLTDGTTDDELFELWVDSDADELPRPEVVREYHIALLRILEELPAKT